MPDLQRLTTEYRDDEDRIRLTGEIEPNRTVVLWLTQRLLVRMLPHLLGWLERQGPAGVDAGIVQGFAQQAAVAALTPQENVRATLHSEQWLVEGVDLHSGDFGLRLVFRCTLAPADGDDATALPTLTLAVPMLRQWLAILHGQCVRGEWTTIAWPEWITEASAPRTGVLH